MINIRISVESLQRNSQVIPCCCVGESVARNIGRTQLAVAVIWRHVIQSIPLKQDCSSGNVNLLEHPLNNPAHSSLDSIGAKIILYLIKNCQDSRLAVWQDIEFVQVRGCAPIACFYRLVGSVGLIEDETVSMSITTRKVDVVYRQMGRAVNIHNVETHRGTSTAVTEAAPDEVL